jgi:protein unc-45
LERRFRVFKDPAFVSWCKLIQLDLIDTNILRAEKLSRDAIDLLDKGGSLEGASRILREASTICPGNPSVTAAFERLKQEESGKGLVALCKKWLASENDDDGEIVLDYIHQHLIIAPEVAAESMIAMLGYHGQSDMADQITGKLLKNPGALRTLARRLKAEPTITYRHLYDRGDDSSNGCTNMLLNSTVWDSEEDRIAAERDVFQLALAQMMRAGEDYPERAMKSISRLLGAEYQNLNGLIDSDGFGVILEKLDIREGKVLRGQATLATAKLFEQSPDSAQSLISQYVVKRVKKPTADGLIQSFSAAAATFPMAPVPAAQLFLSEGFLVNLVKMVSKWKSARLEQSALELLSAACMDRACREAVRKTCFEWIEEMAETSKDSARASQASLILVKINDALPEGENPSPSDSNQKAQDELVFRFKSIILTGGKEGKQDSVEGLAYSSIRPKVKEELANDADFLKRLVNIMGEAKTMRTSLYGGLTILANLTSYLPVLSEEQKKISELKAYANSTKSAALDELDDDVHVTSRCTKVLDASVIPLFILLSTGSNQVCQQSLFPIRGLLGNIVRVWCQKTK